MNYGDRKMRHSWRGVYLFGAVKQRRTVLGRKKERFHCFRPSTLTFLRSRVICTLEVTLRGAECVRGEGERWGKRRGGGKRSPPNCGALVFIATQRRLVAEKKLFFSNVVCGAHTKEELLCGLPSAQWNWSIASPISVCQWAGCRRSPSSIPSLPWPALWVWLTAICEGHGKVWKRTDGFTDANLGRFTR